MVTYINNRGKTIMNNMKLFTSEEFGEVSIIVENNKEYFEATTVANILGYQNPQKAIRDHCKDPGITIRSVGVVTGKKSDGSDAIQFVNKKFIDEGNLYRLIITSKLPSAQKFERWIFDEVLSSIRKNGVYMTDKVLEKTLEDPDYIISIITNLKEEKERRKIAQQRAEELEATITLDRPYTHFGKSIAATSDAITIAQFAKLLNNNDINIGRNRLYEWFRSNSYFIKFGKEKNIPKQIYIEQGLFKISERVVNTIDGDILSTSTLITGKGQMYFLEKIRKTHFSH
jgi:anti-repressor protein